MAKTTPSSRLFRGLALLLPFVGPNAVAQSAAFPTPRSPVPGLAPVSLQSIDLNGDGHLDLVTANRDSGDLSRLLGDSSGLFTPMSNVGLRPQPERVLVGNFDSTGSLDAVTIHPSISTLSVLLDVGAPTPSVTFLDVPDARDVTLGDVDLDGDLDLVIGVNDPSVSIVVWTNNGAGSFVAGPTSQLGFGIERILLADQNHDGQLDAIGATLVGAFQANSVGPALFRLTDHKVELGQRAGIPSEVAAGDIDGDGTCDLVWSRPSEIFPALVYAGSATGWTWLVKFNGSIPAHATALAVTDLDEDGLVDLYLRTSGASQVPGWYSGQNSQAFSYPLALPGGFAQSDVIVVDVNNDGRRDIVTTDDINHEVEAILGDPDGIIAAPNLGPALSGATLIDLDNDNDLDVVMSLGSPATRIGINNGAEGLHWIGPAPSFGGAQAFYKDESTTLPADLNGDGFVDLLYRTRKSNYVFGAIATPGHLSSLLVSSLVDISVKENLSIAAGDLDDDGFLDVAVGSLIDGVSFLRNDGTGNLTEISLLPIQGVETAGDALALTDTDQDGRADLLVGVVPSFNQPFDGRLLVHRRNGAFQFQAPTSTPVGPWPGSFQLRDVTGDGNLDLALTNGTPVVGAAPPETIRVLFGTGSGTFTPGPILTSGLVPTRIRIADLNSDGFDDLVVNNQGDRTLTLFYGDGVGGFTSGGRFSAGYGIALAVGDITNDQVPDILVGEQVFRLRGGGPFPCGELFSTHGGACITPAKLFGTGCLGQTQSVSINLTNTPPVSGFIAVGSGTGTAPGFPGCPALIAPLLPIAIPFSTSVYGQTTLFSLNIPPTTPTVTVYLQGFLTSSHLGVGTTNVLGIHVP